jgi:hypothetical protein
MKKVKADPEKVEAIDKKSRDWFHDNKERAAARQKARYEHDPEYRRRLLEYKKIYYQKKLLQKQQQ